MNNSNSKPEACADNTKAALSYPVLKQLMKATADWVLVLDQTGLIESVEWIKQVEGETTPPDWAGLNWSDTVTIEGHPKLTRLLTAAQKMEPSTWSEVTHLLPRGHEIPARYSTVLLEDNRVLAVGQHMMLTSHLQQQLIRQQQASESELARLAHYKSRYQSVFNLAAEALLCIDTETLRIIEANPAAQRLLCKYIAPLENNVFPGIGFEPNSTLVLEKLLQCAQKEGRADDVAVRSADGRNSFLASATLVRGQSTGIVIVRLAVMTGYGMDVAGGKVTDDVLKELVGQVPLKEMVRQSTELIEKLCIEVALEKSSDNRTLAAEMLGVSRQSLYAKLRRLDLEDDSMQEQQ